MRKRKSSQTVTQVVSKPQVRQSFLGEKIKSNSNITTTRSVLCKYPSQFEDRVPGPAVLYHTCRRVHRHPCAVKDYYILSTLQIKSVRPPV